MSITCPNCLKGFDIMTIQMEDDLRYVFQALPSFGTKYSHMVMGYCQLFGVTPFTIKSKKLRLLIEEMQRLFESQKFSYQKKTFAISHAGIGEALDIMIKRHWDAPLDNHNYLKRVMITISEREEKDGSRKAEAVMQKSEDLQRTTSSRSEKQYSAASESGNEKAGCSDYMSKEKIAENKKRVQGIIKSLNGLPQGNSKELFCIKNNWTITKQHCVERQSSRTACRDCQQGKEIAAELSEGKI